MSRRDRVILLAATLLGTLLFVGGLGYATRATIAAGYVVGSWSVLAGVVGAVGAATVYIAWVVFGPRAIRTQED